MPGVDARPYVGAVREQDVGRRLAREAGASVDPEATTGELDVPGAPPEATADPPRRSRRRRPPAPSDLVDAVAAFLDDLVDAGARDPSSPGPVADAPPTTPGSPPDGPPDPPSHDAR